LTCYTDIDIKGENIALGIIASLDQRTRIEMFTAASGVYNEGIDSDNGMEVEISISPSISALGIKSWADAMTDTQLELDSSRIQHPTLTRL
jgi:hypothetical protein